ncbi:hypothetical protein CJF32_00001686 [Rutstroemia sp. NJR-2017a WRK4]|nr:hypothetical protein CJF32_00001686 [Rutstroemia sp. NJR-2017a WRK4]
MSPYSPLPASTSFLGDYAHGHRLNSHQPTMFNPPPSKAKAIAAHSPPNLKPPQPAPVTTSTPRPCRSTSPAEQELLASLLKAKYRNTSEEVPVRCAFSPRRLFWRRVSNPLASSNTMASPTHSSQFLLEDKGMTDPPSFHFPSLRIWPWMKDKGKEKEQKDSASCRSSVTTRHKREREIGREGLESYGYGFYWRCCNRVCRKMMVIGDPGAGLTAASREPCKRRNSMVKETCDCGHEVCEGCERGVWLGETAED